ncbi:MAG: HEAT repeat domain-containing protein, partial [Planctomycetaceae bacterium]|nr:HEAT repeat domain-containing protein [Planctomycetaceae bacterium]
MTFALEAVGSPEVVPSLTKLLVEQSLTDDQRVGVLNVLAKLARPADLDKVFQAALYPSLPNESRAKVFHNLAESSRSRRIRPSKSVTDDLARMLQQPEIELQVATTELVGAWKVEDLQNPIIQFAQKESTSPALRQAALKALSQLGGAPSRNVLEKLVTQDHPWTFRVQALESLANRNLSAAAKHVAGILAATPKEGDPSVVFAPFLERQQGPEQLAAALKSQTIPTDVAKVGLRLIESTGRPLKELEKALKTAGQISGEPKPLTPAETAELVAAVQSSGDATQGEMIFRRSDLSCLKCHAIGGAGGRVGPDLLSLGASAQVDYLLESLLEPNKKIKENYNSLIVATDEGKVITGVKVRQSDTHLILRDVNDAEVSIPLASIEAQKDGKSLMPSGLTEKLTRNELINLVRFLSELGKVGQFSIGNARVARRWQVLDDTPAARYRLRRTSYDSVTKEDPAYTWSPAYSKVAGALPLDDVPRVGLNLNIRGKAGMGFVRTELDVTQAGEVMLKLNQTDHVLLWLDGKPLEVQ